MFEVESRGPVSVVHVAGDVDVLTSELFRGTIAGAETNVERVVVSLLDCTYLDSTGLTVLIAAQRRLDDRLTVVVPADGNVRKIIDIASLGSFLHIVPTLAEAVPA